MKRAPGSYSGLTAKQAELLSFLRHRDKAGETPSFEEMKAELGLVSKSNIHRLLTSLQERGYIERMLGRARAITVYAEPVARRRSVRTDLQSIRLPALLDELKRRGLTVTMVAGA